MKRILVCALLIASSSSLVKGAQVNNILYAYRDGIFVYNFSGKTLTVSGNYNTMCILNPALNSTDDARTLGRIKKWICYKNKKTIANGQEAVLANSTAGDGSNPSVYSGTASTNGVTMSKGHYIFAHDGSVYNAANRLVNAQNNLAMQSLVYRARKMMVGPNGIIRLH